MTTSLCSTSFKSLAEALHALESTGWIRIGVGGFGTEYQRFLGVAADQVNYPGVLEARLYAGGLLKLRSSQSHAQDLKLPGFVVPSKEVLQCLNNMLDGFNDQLQRRWCGEIAIEWHGHNLFTVRAPQIMAAREEPFPSFPNPLSAYEWATRSAARYLQAAPNRFRAFAPSWPSTSLAAAGSRPAASPCSSTAWPLSSGLKSRAAGHPRRRAHLRTA